MWGEEKEKRELLTVEVIHERLARYVRNYVIEYAVWVVVLGAVLAVGFWGACHFESLSLGLISGAFALFCIFLLVMEFRRIRWGYRVVSRGDFHLTEDILSHVVEDSIASSFSIRFFEVKNFFNIPMAKPRHTLPHEFWFSEHGRVITYYGTTKYSLGDDPYYLVVCNDTERTVIDFFDAKFYYMNESELRRELL